MFRKNFSKIKELADNFKHCGDYGLFFIHKDEDKLLIILGDADECTKQQIQEFVDLGYSVEVEAEYFPFDLDSEEELEWIEFSRGSIPIKWDADCQPIEWAKEECDIDEAKFNEEKARQKFNTWLSEPYGKYSSRGEYMNSEEKNWAWAAFKAALE